MVEQAWQAPPQQPEAELEPAVELPACSLPGAPVLRLPRPYQAWRSRPWPLQRVDSEPYHHRRRQQVLVWQQAKRCATYVHRVGQNTTHADARE